MIITHISTLFSQKQHPTPPFFQNHYPTPTIPHNIDKVKINNSPPATKWIGGVPRRGEVVKNMSFLSFCQKNLRVSAYFQRENNLPILSFCLTSTSLRQPHCELCIMNYALISPFRDFCVKTTFNFQLSFGFRPLITLSTLTTL